MQVLIDFVVGHDDSDQSLLGLTLGAVTHNRVCLIVSSMTEVKLPVVDSNNKFSTGVDNKATDESKLDDSPNSEEACNLTVTVFFDVPSKWTIL